MPEEKCYCGQPLHYSDARLRKIVEEMIKADGPNLRVTVGDRTWEVPKHYVALHGLKAADVPNLGFPEVSGPLGKQWKDRTPEQTAHDLLTLEGNVKELARHVKIVKHANDPICPRVSAGGNGATGFYFVYRGDIDEIMLLLTVVLTALREAVGQEPPITDDSLN
jgi:hypothetical protein